MSRHVAVIGAGAAGLVAARELRREGHSVVVLESGSHVGGTWVHSPEVESDPLGLDPGRAVVHSSLYDSLRTNLPRETMGFTDFPFSSVTDQPGRDPRRFPGHREVLMYLRDFAGEFGIGTESIVRFDSEVVYVGPCEDGKWRVRSKKRGHDDDDDDVDEVYDDVVVCIGHYTHPNVAQIVGIEEWPGNQMHSHNYRNPEPFRDQVVICIGGAASAADISREIATVAKEVHVACRSVADGTAATRQPGYDNLWLHSMIERVHGDGSVVFNDESVAFADVILHCTGYKYHFPFLDTKGIVTVDDNRVGPLYKHVFPPALAPSLSFVGLPWMVLPFVMFEFQSKWIAGVLSGRIKLPSIEEMTEDVNAFYSNLEVSDIPKRRTHYLGLSQYEYFDWLAVQSGSPSYEKWRKEMPLATSKNRIVRPETYRDEWEDDHLVSQAQQDFIQYFPSGINNAKSNSF